VEIAYCLSFLCLSLIVGERNEVGRERKKYFKERKIW
jgi:hypothetical protein